MVGFCACPALAENHHLLWYDQPAHHWVEALPLGNGRLGAMVYGGVESDTIQLNEDTFWSGSPYNNYNPKALAVLPAIREAISQGDYARAQYLSMHHITADRDLTAHGMMYESVGNLIFSYPHQQATDYRRQLDISDAVAQVTYRANGVGYERECFTSFTDSVTLIRLKADHTGKLSFNLSFIGPLKRQRVTAQVSQLGDGLLRVFSYPTESHAENIPNGLHCTTFIQVIPKGGSMKGNDGTIRVENATEAVVIVSSATNFERYDRITGDADAKALRHLQRYLQKGDASVVYAAAKQAHQDYYHRQFDRVKLDMGHNEQQEKKPTDVPIKEYSESHDPGLTATYFQFGRYLLTSSSQPGTQPANLQGIWNPDVDQYLAWESKYTTNINVEMNYWPAEVAQLSE